MKIINTILVLFPLFTLTMQGPITHTTKKALAGHSWSKINAYTPEKLEREIALLMRDAEFVAELPDIIEEGEAESSRLESRACAKDCCIYSKCLVSACLTGTAATCVSRTTNNRDLAEWMCYVGMGATCYQCKSELQSAKCVRHDMKSKIALLKAELDGYENRV